MNDLFYRCNLSQIVCIYSWLNYSNLNTWITTSCLTRWHHATPLVTSHLLRWHHIPLWGMWLNLLSLYAKNIGSYDITQPKMMSFKTSALGCQGGQTDRCWRVAIRLYHVVSVKSSLTSRSFHLVLIYENKLFSKQTNQLWPPNT